MFLGLRTGLGGGLLVSGGPVIKYGANSYVNSVFSTDPLVVDGRSSLLSNRRELSFSDVGWTRVFMGGEPPE